MLLIPAIDLKEGQCVRLKQGDFKQTTIFSEQPVSQALHWVEQGAQRLHIVDLDGAYAGSPKNLAVIAEIAKTLPDIPIQLGGGIRNLATIEQYLEIGIQYAIIGTQAVKEPAFVAKACEAFPGHIIVGLDAKQDQVAIDGWSELSDKTVIEVAQRFADIGVAAIIYTDIQKDGMLQGFNKVSTVALAEAVNIPVIASGGITSLQDIKTLCEIEVTGVMGAVIGRALYEGSLDFQAAQKITIG